MGYLKCDGTKIIYTKSSAQQSFTAGIKICFEDVEHLSAEKRKNKKIQKFFISNTSIAIFAVFKVLILVKKMFLYT